MKKPLDFTIYPYSKISRLPKSLQFSALLLRNFLKRAPKYRYAFDGMATAHNLSFLSDPRFKSATQRAIRAGGFNYDIPLRLHQAIWCADQAITSPPDAIFVELGTGKGYVMSGILESLNYVKADFEDRAVFLFDSFESHATDFKSEQNKSLGRNIYYAESFKSVQENFEQFKNVRLVKGKLPSTLEEIHSKRIAFLHIDLNAPEIEIECLTMLWERIIPGGVILIDDYAYNGFEYTTKLFNEFANNFGVSILTTASGQGIIVR